MHEGRIVRHVKERNMEMVWTADEERDGRNMSINKIFLGEWDASRGSALSAKRKVS